MDAKIGELKHSEPPKKFASYLGEMMGRGNLEFSIIYQSNAQVGCVGGGGTMRRWRRGMGSGKVRGSSAERRLLLIEFRFLVPRLPQGDTWNTCPYRNKVT